MPVNKNNLGGWAIGETVYKWITENIKPASTIIELGSGSGSHELGHNYKMFCVEHDEAFVGKYSNLNYIFAPIREGWYAPEFIELLPKDNALLIIDGPPANIGRLPLLNFIHLFNTSCSIIIDDSHREADRMLADELAQRLGKRKQILHEINKQATVLL